VVATEEGPMWGGVGRIVTGSGKGLHASEGGSTLSPAKRKNKKKNGSHSRKKKSKKDRGDVGFQEELGGWSDEAGKVTTRKWGKQTGRAQYYRNKNKRGNKSLGEERAAQGTNTVGVAPKRRLKKNQKGTWEYELGV